MSLTIVGHCPKCGAPLYSPSMWMGVTSPPVSYSCACNGPNAPRVYTTNTTEAHHRCHCSDCPRNGWEFCPLSISREKEARYRRVFNLVWERLGELPADMASAIEAIDSGETEP
jgi:hypothetical protein